MLVLGIQDKQQSSIRHGMSQALNRSAKSRELLIQVHNKVQTITVETI